MPVATLLLPFAALLAAMVLPVQAAINAQLSRALGNPVAATACSFASGTVLLILLTLVFFRDLPPLAQIGKIPTWLFLTGGALGVVYLVGNVVLVPRLGAATVFVFAIAGQLTMALLLDQFGLLGLAVREISLGRVAGVLMVLAGAVMVRTL